MPKINNRLSQALLLGGLTALVGNVLPAQAQTVPGASEILSSCADQDLSFLDKCDPNADVVRNATNLPNGQPGLSGSFNVRPLGAPAGLALEGTGLTDANGNPIPNIDFSGPSQVKRIPGTNDVELDPAGDPDAIGRFDVLSSTGDFDGILGWSGTIKDLVVPDFGEFNGSGFPNATGERVKDFIVIDQAGAPGNGVIDGLSYKGVAFDLISVGLPTFDPATGNNPETSISFDLELQAYKLDAQGNRIEEQEDLPGDEFAIFANSVNARLSAAFDFTPNTVRDQFDELGELVAWYGYDITFDVQPESIILTEGEVIPEPTTVISSLLLIGGGAVKMAKRKRA